MKTSKTTTEVFEDFITVVDIWKSYKIMYNYEFFHSQNLISFTKINKKELGCESFLRKYPLLAALFGAVHENGGHLTHKNEYDKRCKSCA